MSSIRWDTSEVNKLAADFVRAEGTVGAKVAAAIRDSAKAVERDGKLNAPVLTGAMRESISTNFLGDGRFGSFQAEIGPSVYYAHFVEFGTSRQAPEPFMGPAFEKNAPGLRSAIERASDNFL